MVPVIDRFRRELENHRWYRGELVLAIKELKQDHRVLACQMWPHDEGIRLSVLIQALYMDAEGELYTAVVDQIMPISRALSAARLVLGEF